MLTFIGVVRAIVGILQSLLMLTGCAGLLIGSGGMFSASLTWFLILTGVQLGLVLLALPFARSAAKTEVPECDE